MAIEIDNSFKSEYELSYHNMWGDVAFLSLFHHVGNESEQCQEK